MRLRLTLLIPGLLVASTLVSSALMYSEMVRTRSAALRQEALQHIKLDITRLQNILYNRLTEDNLEEARLNLSVTAMDPRYLSLLLADEADRVLLANRYIWEGHPAARHAAYAPPRAREVRRSNKADVAYDTAGQSLLRGYYPVILKLEDDRGRPGKRLGILFVERSIAADLALARRNATIQSLTFGGVMLAVSALVALLLHMLFSRRLQRLSEASAALAAGDLDARAGIGGRDELAVLGSAFDEMASRIKEDIRRRQQAEQELRHLNETLEEQVALRTEELRGERNFIATVLDTAGALVVVLDTHGRILRFNRACEAATGHAFESVRNRVLWDVLIPPEEREGVRQVFDRLSEAALPSTYENHWLRRDGGKCLIAWSNSVIRGEDGHVRYVIGTGIDISARKAAEQALLQAKEQAERASRAKSEFLSRMSHELRTPMNAILGFSQVLELEPLGSEQRDCVREIHQAGDHLLELINELLDLSRIETGKLALAIQTVPLGPLLAQAMQIVQPLMARQGIDPVNRCAVDAWVLADATRLRQVLVNLLSNAAKYNREGGEVVVACGEMPGDRLRVSVSDTGQGIPPDKLSSLFIPFERLGAEFTRVDGTGIGLALSRELMHMMAGEIGVDSTPGVGSTFWIDLPLGVAAGPAEEMSESLPASPEAGRMRVLYVEDNAANLKLVETMFRRHPRLTLLTAASGEHGVELARRQRPDVILLDIHLPGMDGYEVLHALRSRPETRDIPVIALSADAMPMDVERGLAAGFRAYLTKPVMLDALMQAIGDAIAVS